jgi:hypothetical protein
MAPESGTVSLNRMYRTARTDRGQTGTPWTTNIGSARGPRWAWIAGIGDLRKELRGPEVLEAIMAGVVVAVAIAVFLGGIVVGIMAVVAVAVRREDRRYTLAGEAPGRLARGTRRLTGMRRRDLDAEFLRPVGELVH